MSSSNNQLFKNIVSAFGEKVDGATTNVKKSTTFQITTSVPIKEKTNEIVQENSIPDPFYLKRPKDRVKFTCRPIELKIIEQQLRHQNHSNSSQKKAEDSDAFDEFPGNFFSKL